MSKIKSKSVGEILNEILDEKFKNFQLENNPKTKKLYIPMHKSFEFNDEEILGTVISDFAPFYNVIFHISYEEVDTKKKMSLKEFFIKFM